MDGRGRGPPPGGPGRGRGPGPGRGPPRGRDDRPRGRGPPPSREERGPSGGPERGRRLEPVGPPRGKRFEPMGLPRVYRSQYGVLTENAVPGVRVYGEKLFTHQGKELRAWNPRRSKLAALLLAGAEGLRIGGGETTLYLGAASGTTVSHLSDILQGGRVVALEKSARSMRDLIDVARMRENVDPVLGDAQDTDATSVLLPGGADMVYQDIAQRDQAGIFIRNCRRFLRPGGTGILMVKSRSISIARDPRSVFDEVAGSLRAAGYHIVLQRDLEPWEKDHAAIVVAAPAPGGRGQGRR